MLVVDSLADVVSKHCTAPRLGTTFVDSGCTMQNSTPAKSLPIESRDGSAAPRGSAGVLACLVFLLIAGSAVATSAQRPRYADYPGARDETQSLKWTRLPSWLSLDGQLRGRTEGQTSLGLVTDNDRIYELTRARGGLTVRPASFLRGYLQFQDTHALGLPLPQVGSNMRNQFDLFQGYLDIHPIPKLDLVTGRQELRFGSERLVGISDWTNNSRTFDGFDGHYGDKSWIEAFATSVVATHPTSLDKHGAGLTFYGLVGLLTTVIPHTQLQPFVYVRRETSVRSQQGVAGGLLESTFGTEINGEFADGFYYDAMGAAQRGAYSNDSIAAGFGYAKLGYSFQTDWKPRFTGEYRYASGNAHTDPQRMGTFDQLYPSNHNAFGLVDLFGNRNITESRVDVDLAPLKNLTLLFQAESLHLASVTDNIYSGGGTVFVGAPAGGFRADDLGQGFDASGEYVFNRYLDLQAGVGHFFPGRAIAEGGKPSPSTLGYFQLDYKFKVDHK